MNDPSTKTELVSPIGPREVFFGILALAGLYAVSLHNYLLFHTLTELFSVVIGISLFVIVWNARRLLDNNYLLLIGIAFLMAAGIDIVHTLSYKGVGIFDAAKPYISTQLWLAARYTQGTAFLVAPFFLNRKLKASAALIVYSLITALLLSAIFLWDILPAAYIDGTGLTKFKITSEYIISSILALSLFFLYKNKQSFDPTVLKWIAASILATIVSELAFTLYIGVYDQFNMMGHFLKIIAFYFIYKAVIQTGFVHPFNLLFRNLMVHQEALQKEKEIAQSYLDIAGVIIVVLNTDQTVLLINKMGCAVLGYKEEDIIGKNWFDTFIPPKTREVTKESFSKIVAGSEIEFSAYEYPVLNRNGEERIIFWHNSVLKENNGKIVSTISSGEDITDRVIIREMLQSYREELEQRVKERTEQLMLSNSQLTMEIQERKLAMEETKELSELLDLANDAIMICELDGKIFYWNKGAENLYELPRDRAIGQNIRMLLNPKYLNRFNEVKEILLHDGCWSGEIIHTKSNGTRILMDGQWSLKRNDRNEPVAFIGINRDVTELMKKEKELHDSSLYARSLIEASIDPLVTINSDGIIMDVNQATELVTGISRNHLVGSDFSDYFTDPEMARAGYREVFRSGAVRDYPLSLRHTSGRITDVLYNATLYKNEAGEVQGVFAAARDITELRLAQDDLQKAHDELERRVEERTKLLESTNRELESFSYSVSHDLRAPLRAIDGFSRMILKTHGNQFDEDTNRKFNVIRGNTQMMGQLIDDLLAFSRLGRKGITMSKLNMADLAGDAWQELQVINPERRMKINLQSMPVGYGDRMLMRQVFVNLLSNAVKFTQYAEIADIEVGGYNNGKGNVYYVKDNGVGFDMTYHDKLFGVFQRLHSADTFEGTGVGLAIVQRIIHKHGGKVWAEGKENEGACFYFSLSEKEQTDYL